MGDKLPFVSNGLHLRTSRRGASILSTRHWGVWHFLLPERENPASPAHGKTAFRDQSRDSGQATLFLEWWWQKPRGDTGRARGGFVQFGSGGFSLSMTSSV